MVVILPMNAGEIRNKVKHLGDVKIGVPTSILTFHHSLTDLPTGFTTQCLRFDKVSNAKDQYWNNVAMK